ncbi:MAG: DUF3021 domain-containing protein [Treponema sp.]|nr:DUF3021 domain-containing protein [Treponema sp.]
MLKETIKRAVLGFMYGVFIGQTILIIESLFAGDGNFYAITPYLAAHTNTKLAAVIIQYFITGILGTTFAAGSIIFEMDRWSLLLQTVVHFLITSVVMYFAGFLCGWFPHTALSTLAWFGIFIVVYIIFWASFYSYYKKKTREINESLKK